MRAGTDATHRKVGAAACHCELLGRCRVERARAAIGEGVRGERRPGIRQAGCPSERRRRRDSMANGGASAVGSPNSSCLNALYLRLSETDLTQVLSTHIGQLGADWFDLEGLNISRFPTGYRYGHVVAGRLRTPGGYPHGADEIHTWCSLSGRYCSGTEREMEYIRHSPVINPGRSIVE